MTIKRISTCAGALALLLGASLSHIPSAQAAVAAVTRDVPYVDDDDVKHLADVYVPAGEGPFPAVLMIHGGAWTSGSKGHMLAHARAASSAGYTVVAINYRLAPRDIFPAQIDDCRAAVRWMRSNADKYKIDPERIAAYGYSAGGHLACLLGTSDASDKDAISCRVQCVVAGGAPCEFRRLPDDSPVFSFFLGGTPSEKPDAYRDASPTAFASADDPPVFFFHGGEDRVVPQSS
ncbi:MAG: alpha/beta hydrolase, partial [Planctomycetales bacterium]|nr:alpha/beta hydrolase [Planctomycetales bacterium]